MQKVGFSALVQQEMGKSVDIDTKQIPLCTLIQKYVKPYFNCSKNQRISQQKTVINHLTFFSQQPSIWQGLSLNTHKPV